MNDSGVSASTTAAFAHYERIPLTRDSAKLLEIEPERPPRVVEQTIDQIKNPRSEPAEKQSRTAARPPPHNRTKDVGSECPCEVAAAGHRPTSP